LGADLNWNAIGRPDGLVTGCEIKSEVLFAKLEDELITTLRERYSGSQKDRQKEDKVGNGEWGVGSREGVGSGGCHEAVAKPTTSVAKPTTPEAKPEAPKPVAPFEQTIDLRVAKIEKVERHPKADKLYVIGLEVGEGLSGTREERTIVSGLVGFYTEEQLLSRRIIVAYNLKPAKLRGIESRGMLLAAGDKGGLGPDGQAAERCEVLDAGDTPTGTRLLPEGADALQTPAEIDIDTFFSHPMAVKDFIAQSGGKKLCLNGKPVCTKVIGDGEIH
jgi:methionyl-tRNA synthetase